MTRSFATVCLLAYCAGNHLRVFNRVFLYLLLQKKKGLENEKQDVAVGCWRYVFH